jgi:cysteine-rich repeat protein
MKWYGTLAGLAALASSALAEDVLLVDTLLGREQDRAQALGFTTKVVTEAEWKGMTTSDFSTFKAIVIGDEFGSNDLSLIQFLVDTKDVWGPAVQGNMIIHGADQSNHVKDVLIDNSIKFATAGKATTGAQQTGLYFSLSQYYDSIAVSNVDALSYFGQFEVRGDLSCYDKVHIVAFSPAIDTLTDDYLSNWSCSVHEAFSIYPTQGINGFQAIAIADGVVAPGTQTYADGHSGLPYIITRGATPAGCGDGKWDPSVGEECDDGNTVDGDGCSRSCKCESGLPKGDGTCLPGNSTTPIKNGTVPSGPTGYPSSKPSGYFNSSSIVPSGSVVLPPYPITTPPPPYVTPAPPSVSCIGVEIVVSVTVTELCSTIAPGTTVTSTITSACSTYQKPIYNTQISSMPCYVCALSSQNICSTSGFITATSTYCPNCPKPIPATVYPCATCLGTTLTATCPWATTPAFTNYAVYTSYAPMTETVKAACPTCTAVPTTYAAPAKSPFCSSCSSFATATTAGAVLTPTSTAVQFTGAAAPAANGVMGMIAAAGAGLVGVIAAVL